MNSDKQKVINMIDEMLFIITNSRKEMPLPDSANVGDYLEVDDWMSFRLNSLKEILSPGSGFARQNKDHLDRHAEFLKKVTSLNPQLLRKQAIDLVDEMANEAARLDKMHKQKMIQAMKGEKALGDSWLVFNLRTLRKLMINAFIEEEK